MFSRILLAILVLLSPLALSAAPATVQSGKYVTLSYTLKVDGKVQETNNSFSFIIGGGQVIEGFESGMLGMKTGESKNIIVPPEKGYGTGGTRSTLDTSDIAPVFTREVPKTTIADIVEVTIPKDEIPVNASEIYIGNTIVSSQSGVKAKVIAINNDMVSLRIENTQNPFYKKSKKVGTTVKTDGIIFKIIKESTKSYTLQVTNTKSPFYKKPWKSGATVKTPDGTTIKILKIGTDTVDIETRHPMAGKTLEFDVKIISIQ